ncbi:MAG: hypothetical protein ABJ327_00880 [Litoreibacter sp.]
MNIWKAKIVAEYGALNHVHGFIVADDVVAAEIIALKSNATLDLESCTEWHGSTSNFLSLTF